MKLKDLYLRFRNQLQNIGINTAALDARLLLCHALQMTHEQFVLQGDKEIYPDQVNEIDVLMAQRLDGRPVSKIIGQKEFYGRVFKTTDDTLDPRPDSETLIDAVLRQVDRTKNPVMLDLGTGTGCLILTLLSELPKAQAIAVDLSEAALRVARQNAIRLEVEDRVLCVASDWFCKVTGTFDVIVSNPPYIPAADIPGLAAEVRKYDPLSALVGGEDGLDPYRVIIPQLAGFLNKGGLVAFELGQGQAKQVADMLEKAGFTDVRAHCDLAGIERVVTGKRLE